MVLMTNAGPALTQKQSIRRAVVWEMRPASSRLAMALAPAGYPPMAPISTAPPVSGGRWNSQRHNGRSGAASHSPSSVEPSRPEKIRNGNREGMTTVPHVASPSRMPAATAPDRLRSSQAMPAASPVPTAVLPALHSFCITSLFMLRPPSCRRYSIRRPAI